MRRWIILACVVALVAAIAGMNFGSPVSEKELLRDYSKFVPPWPVYHAALTLASGLDALRNLVVPPHLRMFEHSLVFARTQVAHVLAAFSIPDHIAHSAKTVEELCTLTGIESVDGLWRVLRLAVAQGLLSGSTDSKGLTRFHNNRLSATLRRDHPNSVRMFILFQGQEVYPVWSSLVIALRSGQLPWAVAHPQHPGGLWEYLEAKPEAEQMFSESMTAAGSFGVQATLADYRWQDFDRFVDVGGAHGHFLADLLRKYPSSTGVLFDLPQVVTRAKEVWDHDHPELLPRAEIGPGGSFLNEGDVPAGRSPLDIFVLRVILHDWNDVKALQILRNVRSSIGDSNATLALLELVPREDLKEVFEPKLYMDVQMLVMCDGRERGKAQWEALFKASGFRLAGLYPTRGPMVVVEAHPV